MKQKEIDKDTVIKMFDDLKGQVHAVNQNWLKAFWSSEVMKWIV